MPEESDHDLIIQIKTVQEIMLGEIKELKTGTDRRIAALEIRVDKLEKSAGLFKLATYGYYLFGAGALGLLLYHVVK